MAAGAAEIKARQVRAVIAGARERAVIADLVVGERADEEIARAHVVDIARDVERRAHKRIDDRVGEVGRVLLPELEHGAAVRVAQALPILCIAVHAVWRDAGAWLGSNSVGQAPHITVGGMVPASWWRTMSPNWSTWSSPRITMNARASSGCSALAR